MAVTPDTGFPSYAVARRQQQFLDALEFVDDLIQARQHYKVNVFRSKVPRAAYQLGSGLVKKAYRFHPGTADQRGLHRWRPIQISRAASGGDPGVDACQYNPYKVGYGFETVSYTGFQTERSTDPICVKDIRFLWEMRQQMDLILGFLADVTNSVWENYAREQYLKFCSDAGNGYVLAEGAPNTNVFTYDPFSVDVDGANVITLSATGLDKISTLNWQYFRWLHRFLQMEAPMSAMGMAGGMPQWGLIFDVEDFDKMIEDNANLREDWRYARPTFLLENYGTVESYKGYGLMHDGGAPRFKIKSTDGTNVVLKRVDPLVEVEDITIGKKVSVNPDYLNAEFALGAIWLEDVFRIEVPPAGPTSPGGGTSFGATPSLNGDFHWLVIRDIETNLLGENGFYFGRYEAFAKPLRHNYDCISFLYRRCPHVAPTDCSIGGTSTATAGAEVGLAKDAVAADIDTVNHTFTLTLASVLAEEVGTVGTLKDNDDNTEADAVIADSSQAPTYVFAVPSDHSLGTTADKWTAAGAASFDAAP